MFNTSLLSVRLYGEVWVHNWPINRETWPAKRQGLFTNQGKIAEGLW